MLSIIAELDFEGICVTPSLAHAGVPQFVGI
jgi:hypothetical protein